MKMHITTTVCSSGPMRTVLHGTHTSEARTVQANPFDKTSWAPIRGSAFITGTGNRLFVFEAPIDLLSYLALCPNNWQKSSYVALCGVGGQSLFQMLETHEYLREVCLCLDSDEAGQHASDRLEALLVKKDCACTRLIPERKDWNDDLVAGMQKSFMRMEGLS